MRKVWLSAVVLAALASLGGIVFSVWAKSGTSPSPVLAEIKLIGASGVQHLRVEVARSQGERLEGLMERTALDDDSGMLFVYQQPQSVRAGFWMYRTRIALDIAFLDQRGTILAIHSMSPCTSREPLRCPSYYSPQPYQFALEVNGGYFRKHRVAAGDRVEFVLPERP